MSLSFLLIVLCAKAVLSIWEMFTVICLRSRISEQGRWMPLVEWRWCPQQMAVAITLQSQLHSVNGRTAPGGRTILPKSSTSQDFGENTATGCKAVRWASSRQKGLREQKELGTDTANASVHVVW